MTELAIIADDLTGALDSAAPFAARGLRTVVALSAPALPDALATHASIVAVSTDSREIAPDAARKRVQVALQHLPRWIRLFKKIDSRLKGNLVAELDALDFHKALVVPAIPAFGRLVKDGKLTGFGIDASIDIRQTLGAHAQTALVPDVSSQADIETALAAADDALLVGARGLAEAVAGRMAAENAPAASVLDVHRAIVIIGSRDPITLAQIEHLRAARPDMVYIGAPDGEPARRIEPTDTLVMLHATAGAGGSAPDRVARRLAAALDRAGSLENTLLIVSGGATAQVVLEHLGIAVLEVLGEALPGLPIARAAGFTLITKSGGFGAPDALAGILAGKRLTAAGGVT